MQTEAATRVRAGAEPVGPGCLVLVVGPSGAGKDTLIAAAQEELGARADIHFVRRVITRPPDQTEQSVGSSEEDFARQARNGGFALSWQAHGLHYGIPAEAEHLLSRGHTVVANASRAVVGEARRRFQRCVVILVDAPLEVRRRRLGERGREDAVAVEARVSRDVRVGPEGEPDLRITNDGPVHVGADKLKAAILDAGAVLGR